jgi:hypothetical protein
VTSQAHEQIRGLELSLLDPAIRGSARELDRLLADDFFEIGSSGRVFENKARIIVALAEESGFRFSMHDFETRALGEGIVLATYRVVAQTGDDEEPRSSLRSSIWVRRESWQLVFHQGTRTAAP